MYIPWQAPVITEREMYDQQYKNNDFLGFPWATTIDGRVNLNILYKSIRRNCHITCCQHKDFRQLIPFFQRIGIKILYTPHKILGEDVIRNIHIRPMPLYAVNIENQQRNLIFKGVDFLKCERKYLYSFVGGYQPLHYLTDIRKRIFSMKPRKDHYIKNTGDWHFNQLIYNTSTHNKTHEERATKTADYNKILLESRFSLCPSGSGPNSIRFWESLAVGAIPVLLSDTLELPEHPLWEKTILRVAEKDLEKVPELLENVNNEEEMRGNCLIVYNYFRKNFMNEKPTIIHYCCGSYSSGGIGGVARYDYHISLAFPKRVFFHGPSEKEKMLHFLKICKNPIVITDNHLSCDIPNQYNVLLVHHGCARTTSSRNKDWPEPWKSLCTKGQDKMLTYRTPSTTKIISISQACTHDFTFYYKNNYTKFNIIPLLHSSELNESRFKVKFNENIIVLGNWAHAKKGGKILPILRDRLQNIIFQQLSVGLDDRGVHCFNQRKQDIYLKADIFLQLSNSEGNSYATLDALLCGLPVVASNVGLFYKDVPEDCFVKLDWERNGDIEYVKEKLLYAIEHKEELGRKGREWYMQHCRFEDWKKKIQEIVYKMN